jgi:hypothetical protein
MSSTGSKRRDGRERLLDRVGTGLVAASSGPMRVPDIRIDLSLHPRADLAANGAGGVGEMPADLDGVWQAVQIGGGRLVVLGSPGAGKTVMALELASLSLARARASRGEPIPILLDLVEWRQGGGIDRWLLEGLRDHYGVPIRFGAEMVERNELLVLADSLDAVPEPERAPCVAQFQALSRERPALAVILLSRTDEYGSLPARLPWPTVEVATPTPVQVVRYAQRAGLILGKAGEPKSSHPIQPLTPQVLQLLAIAAPRGASDHGTGTSPPSSWIAIRALRRWLDRSEDRAASEPLVRLIAVELRSRRWWAASLGRLASTGLSQPRLRRAQRMLIIGTTTLVGLVIGLAIGATIDAARTSVSPGGSRLLTGVLLGALMGLADAMVTDAALFGPRNSQLPESSGRPATTRAGPWLLRLAMVVALPAGAVTIRTVTSEPFAIVAVGTSLGALIGVMSRRLPWRDSVRWSWRSFLRKLLIRLAVAVSAGLVLLLLADYSQALLTALGLGLGLSVTSAMVAGFKRRVAPLSQHGPGLTVRIGRVILGGAAIVLAAGTATGLIALTIAPESPSGGDPARWLAAGYLAALVTGLTASVLAATLYGGLELLERWTLASVLVRAGIAHRPVGRSLDELCDGMLLRPAGAGVAFIHRPVLDVLADGTTSRSASGGEGVDATYQAIPW